MLACNPIRVACPPRGSLLLSSSLLFFVVVAVVMLCLCHARVKNSTIKFSV